MNLIFRAATIAAAVIPVWMGLANAAPVVLSPGTVLSNTMGEFSASFDIGNALDQSGLSTGYVSGATILSSYVASLPTHSSLTVNNAFASPTNVMSGSINFDLGSVYALSSFLMWADSGTTATDQSPRHFFLYSSATADFTTTTTLGEFFGLVASPTIPLQVFSFSTTSTRYVRLSILSTNSPPNVNIGELAFAGETAQTPIPSALPLFAGGLGVMAFLARRRKQKALAAA